MAYYTVDKSKLEYYIQKLKEKYPEERKLPVKWKGEIVYYLNLTNIDK